MCMITAVVLRYKCTSSIHGHKLFRECRLLGYFLRPKMCDISKEIKPVMLYTYKQADIL